MIFVLLMLLVSVARADDCAGPQARLLGGCSGDPGVTVNAKDLDQDVIDACNAHRKNVLATSTRKDGKTVQRWMPTNEFDGADYQNCAAQIRDIEARRAEKVKK